MISHKSIDLRINSSRGIGAEKSLELIYGRRFPQRIRRYCSSVLSKRMARSNGQQEFDGKFLCKTS